MGMPKMTMTDRPRGAESAHGGLDKFERAAMESAFTVCILGNPQTGDFALVDPELGPTPEYLFGRGLCFIGVVGIDPDGRPRVELAEPLDDETASAIGQAFVQHVKGKISAAPWLVTTPDMQKN